MSDVNVGLQKSFVKDETLYIIYKQSSIVCIKPIASFNYNSKLNNEIKMESSDDDNYYCLYAHPYVIVYGNFNGSVILYYSTNLIYWQHIVLFANKSISEPIIYYVNNKDTITVKDINNNNITFTQENMIFIKDLNNTSPQQYLIYPSFTKEELFMRI